MPYLTHPVRRMRDDPIPDADVTLLVTAAESTDLDTLVERLAGHGTVEERLRFDAVKVTLPEAAVAAVCDLEGIAAVETANTLALDPDGAGEDVDFGAE